MHMIDDDELVLHHYRDGLDRARLAEIDAALAASAGLRARRDSLMGALGAVDALPPSEPDAGFEARLWRRIAPHIEATRRPKPPTLGERLREWVGTPTPLLAATCVLALAIGLGFYAGRRSAPDPDSLAQARAETAAMRVLDAYVSAHLRATEGVLLTASNSDSAALLDGNRELAASLVDANRLYARAAARAGNAALAGFLRELEPVLISLANQPASTHVEGNAGLRDYLRTTDLLFQVRATKARIDRDGNRRT